MLDYGEVTVLKLVVDFLAHPFFELFSIMFFIAW